MLQSASETSRKRGMQRVRRDGSTQCATCPPLKACPVCPEGHMCQLSIPASCSECPVNTCVADPAFHKSKGEASKIGGALGGIIACCAVGALLYWLYRQRRRKAKEAQRRIREAAKIRLAEEKFRPGDARSASSRLGKESIPGSRQVSKDASINPFKEDSSQHIERSSEVDDDDDDAADEDTEWTELREDGLTTYRKPPGAVQDVIEPDSASAKRRSFGAATHLSRITEGAEEEEDDRHLRYPATMKANTIKEEEEPPSITSRRGRGRTSIMSMRSEIAEKSIPETRQSDTFIYRNPFADGSESGSFHSLQTVGAQRASSVLLGMDYSSGDGDNGWDHITIQQPSPAHRATGAPWIDLQGKEKADVRSFRKSQLESPLTSLVRKPSLPVRKPDLTLLLNDAAIPKTEPSPHSVQSPESGNVLRQSDLLAPWSPYHRDGQHVKAQDFPSDELLNSNVYKLNKGDTSEGAADSKRLSTATASSGGSMSYVMSAPKIITPMHQGVQRLQLQQGKAQLIRVTGKQSSAEKEAKERERSCEARVRNPQSADLSMFDFPFTEGTEDGQDDQDDSPYLSSRSLVSPRSCLSHVPTEVENEAEDEIEGAKSEAGTHRPDNASDFDEVRLQYELAQYPFKDVENHKEG